MESPVQGRKQTYYPLAVDVRNAKKRLEEKKKAGKTPEKIKPVPDEKKRKHLLGTDDMGFLGPLEGESIRKKARRNVGLSDQELEILLRESEEKAAQGSLYNIEHGKRRSSRIAQQQDEPKENAEKQPEKGAPPVAEKATTGKHKRPAVVFFSQCIPELAITIQILKHINDDSSNVNQPQDEQQDEPAIAAKTVEQPEMKPNEQPTITPNRGERRIPPATTGRSPCPAGEKAIHFGYGCHFIFLSMEGVAARLPIPDSHITPQTGNPDGRSYGLL
jgi:hypothetical protein